MGIGVDACSTLPTPSRFALRRRPEQERWLSILLWRPSELWSEHEVGAYFSSRPRLLEEYSFLMEPTLLRILEERYNAETDEVQCLCVLTRSRHASGLPVDKGRAFWVNYRDLLLNQEHSAMLARFLAGKAAARGSSCKRSGKDTGSGSHKKSKSDSL
jgi:hypothetical protein